MLREARELSAKGKRLVEAGVIALALFGPAKNANAYTPPGDDWARLMGTNVTERERDIDRLEANCAHLRAQIASIEMRLDDDRGQYDREPGLKIADKIQLGKLKAELSRDEATMERLQEGMDRGVAAENTRRGNWSEFADSTGLKVTDPTLDLSPRELGSQKVADYYAKHKIGYDDRQHALYFYTNRHGERGRLNVGPGLVSADAYFTDGGNDLSFVFTTTQETYMTLKLDDGIYDGYYQSDKTGRPISPSLE